MACCWPDRLLKLAALIGLGAKNLLAKCTELMRDLSLNHLANFVKKYVGVTEFAKIIDSLQKKLTKIDLHSEL